MTATRICWSILVIFWPMLTIGQDHISSLQEKASQLPPGKEKIELLIQLGKHLQIDKPRQSIRYFEEAHDLALSHNIADLVSTAIYGMALTNYTNHRLNKAIDLLEKRTPALIELQQTDQLQSYYLLLAQIYAKKKDLTGLRRYQLKHQALADSLTNAEAAEVISEVEEKYQKERTISSLALREKNQALSDLQAQEQISLKRQLEIAQLQSQTAALEKENWEKEQAQLIRERDAAELEIVLNRKIQNRNRLIVIAVGLLLLAGVLVQRVRLLQQRKKVVFEKQKSDRLEQIDRMKDQFLANTSHELRTPLHGIIGLAEGLRDGAHENDLEHQNLNLSLIIAAGKRLSNLVNDLLDFSQMRNNELALDLKSIDLWSLAEVVVQINNTVAQAKGITLRNRIAKDAPPVYADENRLQQILYNLIDNAIKFSPDGEIEISARVIEHQIEITVSDQGIGIDAQELASIFEEFKQIEADLDRSYGGTGLGLSISSKLVRLHGGEMWAESEPGIGSRFVFTLPIAKDLPKEQPFQPMVASLHDFPNYLGQETDKASTNGPLDNASQSSIHILIVDDEPINHEVLKNHLADTPYQITSALTGSKALKLLEKGNVFDLVLLDIMMPKMTGYVVCQEIRKKYLASDLPIIMITAKNQVSDLVEALSYGANDYLAKPFSKDEFLARIKTHLDLYHIHRATNRFVPNEFLQSLGYDSITDVKLGDYQERDVTVFFSDIRSYTTMSENMTPEENFRFVAAYVNRMGPIIKQFGGFVLQYQGDGIMALFLDDPDKAVAAAIAMQDRISHYNVKRKERGREPIDVGMGLHSGPLVMGIIGDSSRNDPTTISDAVNIASRMENLTRKFGASILMTKDTMDRLSSTTHLNHRYLGKVMTKGKRKLVEVVEVIVGDSEASIQAKLQTKSIFEGGVRAFTNKEFDRAAEAFAEVVAKNPNDLAASFYLFNARVGSRKIAEESDG